MKFNSFIVGTNDLLWQRQVCVTVEPFTFHFK
jgi:hypothetical protein